MQGVEEKTRSKYVNGWNHMYFDSGNVYYNFNGEILGLNIKVF